MRPAIITDYHNTLRLKDGSLNKPLAILLDRYHRDNIAVLVVTRNNSEEPVALIKAWLDNHFIDYAKIFISPDGDDRKQIAVKKDMLKRIVLDYSILIAIDDKKSVRKMYKQEGIATINPDNLEENSLCKYYPKP